MNTEPYSAPLYCPALEHDACGIGAVVHIKGKKTHKTVQDALKIVQKLAHRAGKDAKGETGDGVGIMLQVSHSFFSVAAKQLGIELGEAQDYGVGMFFMPQDRLARNSAQRLLEVLAQKEGMTVLGWRQVPVNQGVLGERARACMPYICQCFIKRPVHTARGLDFDRLLYVVRREFEQSMDNTYVVSLSSRTIVYKGMFLVDQLGSFYEDLQDQNYTSAMALVHSRFSTNTDPSWERAHPNRVIMHNGEINTIRGNADRMLAREQTMHTPLLEQHLDKILPVVNTNGSDSAMLDNTLEFLMFSGMELPKAIMVTIPEPWRQNQEMTRSHRDLYHYYATMMEPWDGPAAILFSDGEIVGATLDRNGLRPSRYYQTEDDYLILASEVGVLDIPDSKIIKKARLHPGKMLVVDMQKGELLDDTVLKERYANEQPYGEWLDRELIHLKDLPVPNSKTQRHTQEVRNRLYKAFGYTYEEVRDVILPMAQQGIEPTAAMGTDIPLAVLSEKHQSLFSYFKQMFAQVTNPPIDAIREKLVTDTTVYVGVNGNLLEDKAENCRVLQITNPILTARDLMKIRALNMDGLRAQTISLLYYKNTSLERALERLFVQCDKAYQQGASILILSDRGVNENHAAIPSLLAVSALQQYLVRTKKCTLLSIILESAEPRDVHHFATLIGFGAQAVYPYLAHECIGELIEKNLLEKDYTTAVDAYNTAVMNGIMRIASKMGISTMQSYQSAQIFEAIGIKKSVIDQYFTKTVSRIGGIGLEEINQGVHERHNKAFDPMGLDTDETLDSTGMHKLRSGHGKQDHMYNPKTIITLQRAVREGSYEVFKEYADMVDDADTPHTLRGLLEFCFDEHTPIPLDEVETEAQIVRRFQTGAMSYGSLSQEAHECLAAAMNSIGARSNTGEGGEAIARLHSDKCSAVKQVASGRFGVTSEYLVSAKEIQIKIAQGAKPGEGGHLPGNKVYPWVAQTRNATPGVGLISPPPHHDIYSIEDLAQLIYDLKNANRHADISVKLVSEPGVGTIASGVAKAGAHTILVAGYDGGTGAAPGTSIHDAGLPWELGLAEAHQTLIRSGLRSCVQLETDGKLMTGRDVAIACMLGAELFGFATAPLVTMGCVMMRVCNKNTCPVGIATQNPKLRARFQGKPEHVVNFMMFVARQLREIMAQLGIRTVNELVGRSDLLRVKKKQITERAAVVDMSGILNGGQPLPVVYQEKDAYHFGLDKTPDLKVLLKQLEDKLDKKEKATLSIKVQGTDRAFGTIFGSEITKRYANTLDEDSYVIDCTGSGGQSFGAFIPRGLTLRLQGDSNDYFGKGLSGGTLIVYPPKNHKYPTDQSIIIGNVALYGATGGKAFISGVAGERFCVRNSGAYAVVEGVGDHGCEYMTGGCVVILGETGKNFAAGMSGGVVYVIDERHDLYRRLNKEMVMMEQVQQPEDRARLESMLRAHYEATGSQKAKALLDDFAHSVTLFKKIISYDYAHMTERIAAYIEQGETPEQAELKAFFDHTGGAAWAK